MATTASILIVDDEKNTREGLRNSLEEEFDVFVAADVEGALAVLESEPIAVLVTDLRLGGRDGMELIELALQKPRPPICIMMTAYGSVDTAVAAMKRGAYDFVTKPVNLERLEILIKRALQERKITQENQELRRQVQNPRGLESMLGQSEVMVRVFDTIRQVAPSRATVLIEGESGTGKEVAARVLHSLSQRSDKKFVAVHCAALSPQLLESELFGHEKGAFTGAFERRIGRFEQADGGTLFLDEIGEIDPATQVKILRFLGERTFERVGGNTTLQSDVRLLAATNKNLAQMVREGLFREDLYFRLNVVRLTLPPLRERREDIPLLVQAFLKDSARENGKPLREFSPEAMACLISYSWPGNVRELRAAVEHGVVMATGPRIQIADLPETVRSASLGRPVISLPSSSAPPSGSTAPTPSELTSTTELHTLPTAQNLSSTPSLNLDQQEKALILQALEKTRGNRAAAARLLGISRRTLYRRIESLFPNPPHDQR